MSRYWEFQWFHNNLPNPAKIQQKHQHVILSSCNISELCLSINNNNVWNDRRFEFPHWVEYIDLSYNTIYDLYEGESSNYPLPDSLLILNVARNKLTLLPDYLPQKIQVLMARGNIVERLPRILPESLESIQLSFNRLVNWNPENPLPNLKKLDISHNRIQNIKLRDCDKLLYLSIHDNQLRQIDLDKFQPMLVHIELQNNFLRRLPSLPPGLKYLDITHNEIENLSAFPPTLEVLYCGQNQLTYLDELSLMNCKNLSNLDYQGNSHLKVSGAFLDWIEGQFHHLYKTGMRERQIEDIRRGNRDSFQTIYNTPQNVHIFEDGLVLSCNKLIYGHPEWNSWLPGSLDVLIEEAGIWGIPQDVCALIAEEWDMQSNNGRIAARIGDLWCAVWVRLRRMRRKERSIVLDILTREVREVHNVCFTGRIGRILTILQNFDEDVQIVLPISEQIVGRLYVLRKRMEDYPFPVTSIPYLWELECVFSIELMELDLDLEQREIWLSPIREEIFAEINRIGPEKWEEFIENWKQPGGNNARRERKDMFIIRYFDEIEKMKCNY